MTDISDEEAERAIRTSVETMAATIPLDASIAECAIELITAMGERPIAEKLMLVTTAYVGALKMLREAGMEQSWESS